MPTPTAHSQPVPGTGRSAQGAQRAQGPGRVPTRVCWGAAGIAALRGGCGRHRGAELCRSGARQVHLVLLLLMYFRSPLSTLSIRQSCLIVLQAFYCCTGMMWSTAAARGEHCPLQVPRQRLLCSVWCKFSQTFSLLNN